MVLLKHRGVCRNGEIRYYDSAGYRKNLLELEGKEVETITKEVSKKSSYDQFGFYFGGIIQTCLTTEKFGGWDEKEIDEFFCDKFLSYTVMIRVSESKYKEVIRTQSKASLNKKELSEFITKVIDFCAMEGIVIKSPDEYFLGKYRTINNNPEITENNSDQPLF
jgi:hypothetical protein